MYPGFGGCGYSCGTGGYVSPSYGYGGHGVYNDTFILIVVLFILLIIVGATCL